MKSLISDDDDDEDVTFNTTTVVPYNASLIAIKPDELVNKPEKTLLGSAASQSITSQEFNEKFRASEKARSLVLENQTRLVSDKRKRRREDEGSAAVLDGSNAYKGPWASYHDSSSDNVENNTSDSTSDDEDENLSKPARKSASKTVTESTKFHGQSLYNYQGKSFIAEPRDTGLKLNKDYEDMECFLPKKVVHTWQAHGQGVSAIRFFPRSGHLLLSAGVDANMKIWDCHHDRSLLRTYSGHQRIVRDIQFSSDGTKFLSASYDRMMKLWDTETGKVISRFSTGKLPHCINFNPDQELNHEFLAGMSDNKIVQFDTRSGALSQEYDHHLGPVNTITFVDSNRRFATTSDDKSLRVWEYGIPVPIKIISEPYLHSMPSVALHPSHKYFAAQSLDNQIFVFQAEEKFRKHRSKIFKGNNCAGYAVQVSFSPDGRFISAGDASGYACFWNWKTGKLLNKIKASESALTCIDWNPQETSKVATAGLKDGVIKYWD